MIVSKSKTSHLNISIGHVLAKISLSQIVFGKQVVAVDFAQEMLDYAQRRPESKDSWNQASIEWIQGDALDLPFPEDSFDSATVGYGLRNVSPKLQFSLPMIMTQFLYCYRVYTTNLVLNLVLLATNLDSAVWSQSALNFHTLSLKLDKAHKIK